MRLIIFGLCLSGLIGCGDGVDRVLHTDTRRADDRVIQWLSEVESLRDASNHHMAHKQTSKREYADWIDRGRKIPGVADALQWLLAQGDKRVDPSHVAYALSWVGNSSNTPVLIEALGKDDLYLRLQAAAALGRVGSAKAVEPLCWALKNDTDSNVRANAALALGRFAKDSEDARRSLERAASEDASDFVRELAAEALEEARGSS